MKLELVARYQLMTQRFFEVKGERLMVGPMAFSVEITGMKEGEGEDEVGLRTVGGEEGAGEGPLCNHEVTQAVHHRQAWFPLHQQYHFLLQLKIRTQAPTRIPMPRQKS